ncbi:hypothetical protein AQUCO_01100007v1 [Aquilegia coerulea]|uniref:Uncharacterized protein n=1 Tax=Aquilegia coerulea TaxID=218851 RepID=A0A2G5E552_AQUCA|nr:hypothetical protein AQUCO_01100007v1 [Aquilegia coerulea]
MYSIQYKQQITKLCSCFWKREILLYQLGLWQYDSASEEDLHRTEVVFHEARIRRRQGGIIHSYNHLVVQHT